MKYVYIECTELEMIHKIMSSKWILHTVGTMKPGTSHPSNGEAFVSQKGHFFQRINVLKACLQLEGQPSIILVKLYAF